MHTYVYTHLHHNTHAHLHHNTHTHARAHTHTHAHTCTQVTDFDIRDGVVSLECAEALVGDVKLTFIDGKTQQPVESPRTRPEVILRHMTTAPGCVLEDFLEVRGLCHVR
eukprot:scaffold56974_cov30-Tisochrysis_lutea.AAC.1